MLSLTRTMLPAFALAAMMAAAQAQTIDQDHTAHHPDGTGAAQTKEVPVAGQAGNTPMIGQGMGSAMIVQPGTQQPRGQTGMMGDMGMMGNMGQMMPMMRRQDGMGMPFEHVEGRVAFLKAEIGITDAQQKVWNDFADAMRRNAETHRTMHRQMMSLEAAASSDWQERLGRRARLMTARAEAMSALNAAAGPLFAALSEDQRDKAERLLSGPMGMM